MAREIKALCLILNAELPPLGEAVAILPAPQYSPWAILVPFALPEEVVIAKIYRHSKMHSYADLVQVITPNATLRDDGLIKCKYFGTCGGCQYQVIADPCFSICFIYRRVTSKLTSRCRADAAV